MKKITTLAIFICIASAIFAIPKTRSNGVMVAIDEYLSENADDPKSISYVNAGYLIEFEQGFFSQKVKFRAKNKYGAIVLNEFYFTVTYNSFESKVVSTDRVEDVRQLVNSGKLKIKHWYNPHSGGIISNKDLQIL